jgi:predicted nuclease with RNAse H fold
VLDGADEVAGVVQGVEGPGVQPGHATLEHLDREATLFEVVPADVGDLVLAARRGLELARDLDDVLVVEVQPWNSEVAARVLRLLLQRHRLPAGVELHHAVLTGVRDAIGEDGGAVDQGEAAEMATEAVAVEDVVAEDQRAGLVADEVGPDREGLGETLR